MIYICIPAHNEERTIGVVLWKIRQVMANFPRDYQILVANDASSDKTSDVLEPYQRVLPLSVLQLQKRRGYAPALELLLREAVRRAEYPKRDVIVTIQADFSEDPEHLTALLKRIEAGADVVCTNTSLPEKAPRTQRWARRIGRALMGRRRWPAEVTDPLSGFRAYRVHTVRKALEQVGSTHLLTWDGTAANVELLTLVLPHARRTDVLEAMVRSDRQQRATRQTFWSVVGSMLRLSSGGAGPLQGRTLEPAPWEAATSRRNRADRRPQQPQSPEPRPSNEREGRRGRRPQPTRAAKVEGEPRKRRTRSRKNGNGQAPSTGSAESPMLEVISAESIASAGAARKKKRRRRRKPGANRSQLNGGAPADAQVETTGAAPAIVEPVEGAAVAGSGAKRRRNRRGRGRRGRRNGGNTTTSSGVSSSEGSEPATGGADTTRSEPPEPFPETGTD